MTLAQKFSPDKSLFVGSLLMLPAVLYWGAVILEQLFDNPFFIDKFFLPMDNLSSIFPVSRMFLLPLMAFAANLFSIVRIKVKREEAEIKGSFIFELKLMNILLLVFITISTTMILGYLFVENYNHP